MEKILVLSTKSTKNSLGIRPNHVPMQEQSNCTSERLTQRINYLTLDRAERMMNTRRDARKLIDIARASISDFH